MPSSAPWISNRMSPTVPGIEAQRLSRYSVFGSSTNGSEDIRLCGHGCVSWRSTSSAKDRRPFIVMVVSGRTSPLSSVQPAGWPSVHRSNPPLLTKEWPSGFGFTACRGGFLARLASAASASGLSGLVGGVKSLVRRTSSKMAKSSRSPFELLRPPT